ncbi:Ion channel [compost metagenome]
MFIQVLISLAIIAATIIVHGFGSTWLLNYYLKRHDLNQAFKFSKIMRLLSYTAIFLMLMHYIEIMIWAAAFLVIPEVDQLNSWEEAIYFSSVTYTSLGYGDITLAPVWRIMSGFEAMNGILLIGWSTAMFYAVVQRVVPKIKK